MKNGYELLMLLTKNLNESMPIMDDILKNGKESFSNNEEHINVFLGILSETREILSSIDENVFFLNPKLYDLIVPIRNYSNRLFNDYKLVNSYKLYDCITNDILSLKDYLNKIEG